MEMRQGRVHGGVVALHHGFAALAVSLVNGLLDGGDGFVGGRMPLMAKKQVCMMVLMRLPMPATPATL